MSKAMQLLGSKISLISKSEIRYEGILFTLNPNESTLALAKGKRLFSFFFFFLSTCWIFSAGSMTACISLVLFIVLANKMPT